MDYFEIAAEHYQDLYNLAERRYSNKCRETEKLKLEIVQLKLKLKETS